MLVGEQWQETHSTPQHPSRSPLEAPLVLHLLILLLDLLVVLGEDGTVEVSPGVLSLRHQLLHLLLNQPAGRDRQRCGVWVLSQTCSRTGISVGLFV
ncbi:hypothetical protein E2C01_079528 [Portunus trituberculatus]|uniref:Uncharacterized protein n=1 Tax=Portunus trituberculatus TaxID=210409 RepID=A0A5B7IRN0_PORTR|nr:hypothetical protein [Portunus trituberculatus]